MNNGALSITMEEAYAEACQALGETVVRERLLMKRAYFPEEETVEAGGQVADSNLAAARNAGSNGHGDISGGTDATKLTEAANGNGDRK